MRASTFDRLTSVYPDYLYFPFSFHLSEICSSVLASFLGRLLLQWPLATSDWYLTSLTALKERKVFFYATFIQSPRANSDWLNLGHVPISEPITKAIGMKLTDWLFSSPMFTLRGMMGSILSQSINGGKEHGSEGKWESEGNIFWAGANNNIQVNLNLASSLAAGLESPNSTRLKW